MDDTRFRPRDYIAIILVVCCFVSLFLGFDGEIKALLGLIVGFYFGLYTITPKDNQNGQTNSTEHPA